MILNSAHFRSFSQTETDFAAKKTPFLFLARLSFSDCLSSPNCRTNTCKCLCPRERLFVRRNEPWMLTVPVDHEL